MAYETLRGYFKITSGTERLEEYVSPSVLESKLTELIREDLVFAEKPRRSLGEGLIGCVFKRTPEAKPDSRIVYDAVPMSVLHNSPQIGQVREFHFTYLDEKQQEQEKIITHYDPFLAYLHFAAEINQPATLSRIVK